MIVIVVVVVVVVVAANAAAVKFFRCELLGWPKQKRRTWSCQMVARSLMYSPGMMAFVQRAGRSIGRRSLACGSLFLSRIFLSFGRNIRSRPVSANIALSLILILISSSSP